MQIKIAKEHPAEKNIKTETFDKSMMNTINDIAQVLLISNRRF